MQMQWMGEESANHSTQSVFLLRYDLFMSFFPLHRLLFLTFMTLLNETLNSEWAKRICIAFKIKVHYEGRQKENHREKHKKYQKSIWNEGVSKSTSASSHWQRMPLNVKCEKHLSLQFCIDHSINMCFTLLLISFAN